MNPWVTQIRDKCESVVFYWEIAAKFLIVYKLIAGWKYAT